VKAGEERVAIVQQIQKRMIVSLAQIAKDLNLHEGDHVLIEEKDGGIFLRPVDWVDKNQKYFWTKEWQEKMKLSQEALENGEYKTFSNMEEAIKDLEELAHASNNKNQTI
jgi:AbrB family looped-hinge helix DNA binding protein